jgi:hypothetical protein
MPQLYGKTLQVSDEICGATRFTMAGSGIAASMARRVLVVTTASAPKADVESIVRRHAGDDAEVYVVAPASKISRLDRLTNAEDDARSDAAARARAASDEIAAASEAHVGDVDPLRAIEDALRVFPADEIVVLTAPDERSTWLEDGLGEDARARFLIPVTPLVTA